MVLLFLEATSTVNRILHSPMACAARHPALLDNPSASNVVDPFWISTKCCCTVAAWKAPSTSTGSLANSLPRLGSSRMKFTRGTFRRKNGIWGPSYNCVLRKSHLMCQAQAESYSTEEYTLTTLWENLISSISYLPQTDVSKVKNAFELAFYAHDGQKRRSGEPYIIHPVEVGRILGELEMDWETIAAGLLHDTVEDTDLVTFEKLEQEFGYNVRRIVEGETKVSKLGKLQCSDSEINMRDVKADDLRQMFLAMTEEVRVIIVKLADRLHNMRTLSFMPPHKQRHIALETLQIFAPLARLLGMYKIKSELEELSFMYAHPSDYADLKKRVDLLCKNQSEMVLQVKNALTQTIQKDQCLKHVTQDVKVLTLWKELYSIYKKMKEPSCTSEEIGDVAQVRIVLQPKHDSARDQLCNVQQACYHVLGLVHALWRPVPQTMKDYIATPKPNGYQSLHTKVIPFGSKTFSPLEIQIRTEEMDKLAEYGIAVHYSGKMVFSCDSNATSQNKPFLINGTSSGKAKLQQPRAANCLNAADLARRVSWLNSIREWQEEFVGNMTSREFVDTVTGDLFGSRVFVFTPKGEIKNLPKGATVIDYAYQIHTDVGNKMVAAKVNGNLVSPTHILSNAEVVEIVTYDGVSNKKHFLRHKRWLQFARTRSARHKLTKFLKEQAALAAIELTADAIKKFLLGSDDVDGENERDFSNGRNKNTLDSKSPNTSLISFRGHLTNSRPDLNNPGSYIPKLLPAQDSMMYGGRMINGKHSKRADLAGRLGRGTCIVGSAASNSQRSFTHLNAIAFQDEARPTLETWLIGRVTMWHEFGAPIQWFSVCCLDRKSMLAEVTAVLGAAGVLICACVAETDRIKGLGTMLFQIEGNTDKLVEACSSVDLIDGVLNWSLGCSWQPPDARQHPDAQYEA